MSSVFQCLQCSSVPVSSVFQCLQCSSVFSVPVSSVFQCLQCSSVFSTPVSSVLQCLQYSSVFSTPVSSVFQCLQYSSVFSIPVSSVFQCLQYSSVFSVPVSPEADRSRPLQSLLEGRLLGRSSVFVYFSSSASRGLHESGCPWGRTLWCGYPWPNNLEVFLGPRAEQDRQEPFNWCLVNLGCSLRPNACPVLALWVVKKGQFSSVQRDVASHPLGQLFCVIFTKLTWSPLLWSFQGVDFLIIPSSEGKPRGHASTRSIERKRSAVGTSSTSGAA